MDAMHLIRLHLELECTGIDPHGQLVPIPCAHPDTFPRVYVARHHSGDTLFCSAALPKSICQRLKQLPFHAYFEDPERVKAILFEDGPCEEIHIGKSYIFPHTLRPEDFSHAVRLSRLDPEIVRQYDPGMDLTGRDVFGILVGSQVVSTCESARENEYAGEAWVRTLPEFRRRGFARQVTIAWAHDLQQRGKVPFYSHKWENFASQSLAQTLGLIQYIDDAGYA